MGDSEGGYWTGTQVTHPHCNFPTPFRARPAVSGRACQAVPETFKLVVGHLHGGRGPGGF